MKTIIEKQKRSIYFKALAGVATVDESDNVFGYLAAFGNKDNDGDRLWKGCCAKSIVERGPASVTARKIAYLHTHNQEVPVGKFTKLEEQDKGLYYEGILSKVPYVQETVKVQLKEQILNNHSIGYNYIPDKMSWNEEDMCWDIKELDLYEGSLLVLGTNENTPFGGFKKFVDAQDRVKDLHLKAEKALKKINSFNKEYELRGIIQQYQSLLDFAAEEITAMKTKPTTFDYKALVRDFNL